MAVAIGHAATKKSHSRPDKRLTVKIFGFRQPGEEVTELLDGKSVIHREFFHVAFIAAVVAELMARFSDTDLWNSEGIPFATEAESGHACHICLECEHDQVVNSTEIIARHGGRDIAIGTLAIGARDSGKWRIEPSIGTPRAGFRFSNRGEILIEASFVCRSHCLLEPTHFREIGVQHAAFAA